VIVKVKNDYIKRKNISSLNYIYYNFETIELIPSIYSIVLINTIYSIYCCGGVFFFLSCLRRTNCTLGLTPARGGPSPAPMSLRATCLCGTHFRSSLSKRGCL
jgi:hypothetical protein